MAAATTPPAAPTAPAGGAGGPSYGAYGGSWDQLAAFVNAGGARARLHVQRAIADQAEQQAILGAPKGQNAQDTALQRRAVNERARLAREMATTQETDEREAARQAARDLTYTQRRDEARAFAAAQREVRMRERLAWQNAAAQRRVNQEQLEQAEWWRRLPGQGFFRAVGAVHQGIASMPTPGGISMMVAALVGLLLIIIPVGAKGETRAQLAWDVALGDKALPLPSDPGSGGSAGGASGGPLPPGGIGAPNPHITIPGIGTIPMPFALTQADLSAASAVPMDFVPGDLLGSNGMSGASSLPGSSQPM